MRAMPDVPRAYNPVPTDSEQEHQPLPFSLCCRITSAIVLLAAAIWGIVSISFPFSRRGLEQNLTDPFFTSSLVSQTSQCGCPRLGIFPFDAACPANCTSHRIGVETNTFYRTSSAFVFGKLEPFRQQQSPVEHFKGGASIAQAFIKSEKAVIDSVMAQVEQAKLPPLSVHRQSHMKLSVDHVCCLTEQETQIAQKERSLFIAQHYNSFPLQLDRVQCFQDRMDSITLAWIADGVSQQVLLRATHWLADAMRVKGVPVLVGRTLQMPFHSTLVEFTAPQGEEISKYRKVIHDAVEATGSHTLRTIVDFDFELGSWELSRNESEIHYPSYKYLGDAKWYVQENCEG